MNKLGELIKIQEEITQDIEKIRETPAKYSVVDGVIDPEKYLNAKYRILWILKEANSESLSWSYLTNFKRKEWLGMHGRSSPTLRRVIYTTYGILKDCNYDDMPWANEEEAYSPLQEIAFINIKKEPGDSIAEADQIQQAYYDYRDLLKKQIDAYDADIVIFGNTLGYFYREDFKGLPNTEKQVTEMGNHFYNTGEKLYIHTWHPAYRGSSNKDYVDDIVNIVRNWKK